MKPKFQTVNNHSKTATFIFCCLLCAMQVTAQQQKHIYWYNDSAAHKLHIRNFVSITPVGKTARINGLAIGLAARPWVDADSLEVNGLNIELNPISPVFGIHAIMSAPVAIFKRGDDELINSDSFPPPYANRPSTVNGLTVSSGIWPGTNLNGVSMSLSASFANTSDGLEVSGIMNMHYRFNGVIIALLRNKTTIGKGVQIGLFNSCREGRLLQIGLLNRIGNRVTPIVNLRLNRKDLTPGPIQSPRTKTQ